MTELRGSDLMPNNTLGQYVIRTRIGSGGMGEVYDAMHTALNRRVAIKTLRRRFLDDDTVVARFLREGQLASRIRHPNIVDVTDVGMIGGLPCLVMEHLEGEPLGNVIKRDGALPLQTLVDLLLPIVAAVDHAHERGVLHRDIKPSNIFLARSWNGDLTPKILDFGISKLLDESEQAALTTDSAFVGTPHYASPELMRAERGADGRADQYSMGVVLYEGATGAKPFIEKGGNFVALAMAICNGDFPRPRTVVPSLPAAFENVVMKAMAMAPDSRYSSMRALGEALLPFASERARMIWSPTFAGSGGVDSFPKQDGTAVIARPLGMTGPSGGYPSVQPQNMTPRSGVSYPGVNPLTTGPFPSATPPPGGPGPLDRTPSYGLGSPSFAGTPPKKGNAVTAMVVGLAVVTLAIVGLALVRWSRPTGASAASETPASATPLTTATSYKLFVAVTPANATIEVDGATAGTGAVSRDMAKDGQPHVLRASAPGFSETVVPFDEAHPAPPTIVLRPAASAASAATAQPVRPVNVGGGAHPVQTAKNPDKGPKTDNINPWE